MRAIMPMLMTLVLLIAQPALADSSSPAAPEKNDLQDIMVGVAISGGGLRSAAFAYGVISMLDEERICQVVDKSRTNTDNSEKEKEITYKWIIVAKKDTDKCLKPETAKNLLDEVQIVSGVSGGALPAAFLHWYGKDYFLTNFERSGLMDLKDLADALTGGFEKALRIEKGDILFDMLPFVPGSLLTAKSLEAQFRVAKGIVDINTVSEFFRKKTLFNQDKKLKDPKHRLLIHTTDLTNSGIFTFYGQDGECLSSKDFAIEDVLAASAAMPGLVGPLIVFPANAMSLSSDCSKRYGNAERNAKPNTGMFLNDGGVYDNLAIDGLLGYLVDRKRGGNGLQGMQKSEAQAMPSRTLLLAINAAPPAAFATLDPQAGLPGIVALVLRAFDLLAGQKDATTRFLFEEAQRYGIHVVELNFSGLLPESGRDDRAIQMLRTLGGISWFPNEQEIQTLIAAGRLVAANQAGRIGEALNALSSRANVGDCPSLSEEDKEYCWPKRWADYNPFHEGLERVLQEVRKDRDDLRKRQGKFLKEGRDGAGATLVDAMAQAGSEDQVYAVDYGLIDWKGGFSKYQEANVAALRDRRVKIARTFIIHEELLKESPRTRLQRLIEVILAQIKAGVSVRIALKETLKNDQRTVAQYHRGHRNGMVLFKYCPKDEPKYKVLMEEATEYSGEPGHPGLYYALQTHAIVDPKPGSSKQTCDTDSKDPVKAMLDPKPTSSDQGGGMSSADPVKKQRQHVEDRASFLEWINEKAPSDIVCLLFAGGKWQEDEIMDALQENETPCQSRAKRAKANALKPAAQ